MNPIEEFNRVRRILFSTFHKSQKGQIDAFEYLEGYRKKLGPQSYVGLKAELGFYKKYRKEYSLSVSADVGDHTDFSGLMSKEIFRFDVTTNPDYKKLKDYEPLQKNIDAKYKIAVVNHSGDIEELIDINFPFCPECEEGRMLETVVLLPENYNAKGECNWTNDQLLIGVCSHCQNYEEQKRISTHFLNDFNTEINNALEYDRVRLDYLESQDEIAEFDENQIIKNHSNNILPYLHKQFDKTIISLSDRAYKVTDPRDGDGYNYLKVQWKKNLKLLDDYILDEYEIDLE